MKQDSQIWAVFGVIALFLTAGFVYKYTIAPGVAKNTTVSKEMPAVENMMNIPLVAEIGADPSAIPPPITRKESAMVKVALEAIAVRALLAPGVTYEYWTYNKQVPGPFIRVREGDTVEISLYHNPAGHSHAPMSLDGLNLEFSGPMGVDTAYAHGDEEEPATTASDAHTQAMPVAMGHETHSIDLHAVLGLGGGAVLMQTGESETKTFAFKALRPGIYIYHCASPHIPTHIANGMYGMILVEPKAGLAKVDHEYYVMQGEFYTTGKRGEEGQQGFSIEKLDAEAPEYVVFNGRVGSLTGARALQSKVGESVRIFFAVGTFLPSNFHIIGGILDKLYPEGDLLSPPHRNVQTTLVPAGGAMMTEFTTEVPGKFLLVDHALPRAIDKGALGEMVVTGPDQPEIIHAVTRP